MNTAVKSTRVAPNPIHIATAILAWLGVEIAAVGGFDLIMLNSGVGWPMIAIGASVALLGVLLLIWQRLRVPFGLLRACILAMSLSPITVFPVFIGWQISVTKSMINHCEDGEAVSCRVVAAKKAKRGKIDEALTWYTKGCEMNNARSCRELAGQAKNFPDKVSTAPLSLYTKACDLGDAIGCDRAAHELRESNHQQALAYFTKACELDYLSACNVLEEIKSHPAEHPTYPQGQ